MMKGWQIDITKTRKISSRRTGVFSPEGADGAERRSTDQSINQYKAS